jgi:hypothetical protein
MIAPETEIPKSWSVVKNPWFVGSKTASFLKEGNDESADVFFLPVASPSRRGVEE